MFEGLESFIFLQWSDFHLTLLLINRMFIGWRWVNVHLCPHLIWANSLTDQRPTLLVQVHISPLSPFIVLFWPLKSLQKRHVLGQKDWELTVFFRWASNWYWLNLVMKFKVSNITFQSCRWGLREATPHHHLLLHPLLLTNSQGGAHRLSVFPDVIDYLHGIVCHTFFLGIFCDVFFCSNCDLNLAHLWMEAVLGGRKAFRWANLKLWLTFKICNGKWHWRWQRHWNYAVGKDIEMMLFDFTLR